MYVCMYVRMYVRMYVCTYVCTYVCMYVRMCMYVVMHVDITRTKLSPHLATASCGERGVPRSAVHVAWLAEEL